MDIDNLTDAQLDRLQQRLTVRADHHKAQLAAKLAADREKREHRPLRPQTGSAGILFGNDLARRSWDEACIAALERQTVPYAVAPLASVLTRDGRSRLGPGQEVRPTEHLDARNGDLMIQMEKLVESGHVLARVFAKAGAL